MTNNVSKHTLARYTVDTYYGVYDYVGIQILSSFDISHKWAKKMRGIVMARRYTVSPSSHVMFYLWYWNWWNGHGDIFTCKDKNSSLCSDNNIIFTLTCEDITSLLL